eukprot:gene15147-5249_t
MDPIAKQLDGNGAVVMDMRAYQDPHAARAACYEAWANANEIKPEFRGTIPPHAAFGTCPFSANLNPRPDGPNDIRRRLHHAVAVMLAHLQCFGDDAKVMLLQLLDTLCHREKAPGFEGSHRDETPGAPPNSIVLGGFYNMGPEEITFTYVPGTHKGQSGSGGFAKLSKEDHKRYKDKMVTIVVPVGFLLLFNEKLVHMVAAKKPKGGMNMKLFMGFVVGPDVTGPINNDIEWALDNTGNFPRKSGQYAETYPIFWGVNWWEKVEALSRIVKEELLVNSVRKGNPVRAVTRVMNQRGGHVLRNPFPPLPQAYKDLFLKPTLVKEAAAGGGGGGSTKETDAAGGGDGEPPQKKQKIEREPVKSHRGSPALPIIF